MPTRRIDPNDIPRPSDQTVHDIVLAWFTTPRLQDELLTRDRDAIQHVLGVLRRRLRTGGSSDQRTRNDAKGRGGLL